MDRGYSREPPVVPLKYSIAGCSEHSGKYVAENILVDNPSDQTSRWSGAYYQSPNVKQWMLLRLQHLTILKSLTFGKFHKPHPCNMKEFKVYVGLTEDNMTEVLRASLKNDSNPETFSIRHMNDAGICFPTRYIKIVPLSAHGQSFHTSIWHVAMMGVVDDAYVEQINARHEQFREISVLRYVLKHLRQRRFLTPFTDILTRSGVHLEHPSLTKLHEQLVLAGDWLQAEQTIYDISSAGMFSSYRQACQPRARWTRIVMPDGVPAPNPRGGHAMCIDKQSKKIYLHGGWDGQSSLEDFWAFDEWHERWDACSSASRITAPGPRACHKMVVDEKTGSIYVLGRLGDADALDSGNTRRLNVGRNIAPTSPRSSTPTHPGESTRSSDPPRHSEVAPLPWSFVSEFYRYHTRHPMGGEWELLSYDTASTGGPPLIFDHQMVIDSEAQMIYVFGGRIIDGDWETYKSSGLYAYDISSGMWSPIQTIDANGVHPSIPPRFGHSMVMDPYTHTLFIFAGQRDDKYLSDMYAYHIPTGTVTELFANFTLAGGPDPCFTQRAVIDPELKEIYVFCGLTRNRSGSLTVLETEAPHWIYRYERPDRPGKWTQILPADPANMPQPRYAHQVVYDADAKVVYMHGGNSGAVNHATSGTVLLGSEEGRGIGGSQALEGPDAAKEHRLDDFWKMQLERPALEDIVRQAIYEIRQQQFRELCEDQPAVKALAFLQTSVSPVVDHSNPDEAETFRLLLSHLLSRPTNGHDGEPSGSATETAPNEDEEMADSTETASQLALSRKSVILLDQDPRERTLHAGAAPSEARFRQRTRIFEKLLEFINKQDKQPDENLLDMINTDKEE